MIRDNIPLLNKSLTKLTPSHGRVGLARSRESKGARGPPLPKYHDLVWMFPKYQSRSTAARVTHRARGGGREER